MTPADADSHSPVRRSSLARNIASMASSQVAAWVIATGVALIVPRYLGPVTQGRIQLASSLWAIAGVFTALGLSSYLQLEVARHQRDGLDLIAPVIRLRTGAFALSTAVLIGVVFALNEDRQFVGFFVLAGLVALLGLWADVFASVFLGLERMTDMAFLAVSLRFLGLIATVLAVVFDLGVFGVLWAGVGVAFVGLVGYGWKLQKLARIDWRSRSAPMRHIAAQGMPFMIVALALVTYRQIDVIVIAQVAGPRDLGWYSAADGLFGSLLFPTAAVLGSVFPTMGRLHADDPAGLERLVRKTFSLLLLISVPIGLGAVAVGPTFAPQLFGGKYSGTGALIAIFGPVTILTFGTSLFSTVSIATNRRKLVATLLFGSAALTVPLDILLVPWTSDRFDNGAIGGVLAFLITETIQFAVLVRMVAPYVIDKASLWRTFRIAVAGGLMLLVVWPFRELVIVVPVAIGAVVYVGAVLGLRVLTADERHLIQRVTDRVGITSRM